MSALAAVPECPALPAEYAGSDDTIRELRAGRREAVETCQALRAVGVESRDTLTGQSGPAGDLADDVRAIREAVEARPAGTETDPYAVTGAAGPQGEETATEATARRSADTLEGVHETLWILAGILLAGLPAYGLYRLVMPRA